MSIIRKQLDVLGYSVRETTLHSADWNAIEHRERMCMVATSKGLSTDDLWPDNPPRYARKVGEILEKIPDDHPSWSRMEGLINKEERDLKAKKGFKMQIFDEESPHYTTVGAGYAKVRSTEPKIRNAKNPDLLRQLTVGEHAAGKDIPVGLVHGLCPSVAHQYLGQAICLKPFKALGSSIGRYLLKCLRHLSAKPVEEEFQLLMC